MRKKKIECYKKMVMVMVLLKVKEMVLLRVKVMVQLKVKLLLLKNLVSGKP